MPKNTEILDTNMQSEEVLLSLLHDCFLFRDYTRSSFKAVLPLLEPELQKVGRHSVLTRVNDPADRLWLVLSGRISESRPTVGAGRRVLRYYSKGELVGLTAMFSSPQQSHVELVAEQDSVLLRFNYRALLGDDPAHRAALQLLADDCVRAVLKLNTLSATGLREKIMTFFRAMRDKYGADSFQLRMTQGEFAEYLGVNRSALSSELNDMQREGILQILPERRYRIMKWDLPPQKRRTGKENHENKPRGKRDE